MKVPQIDRATLTRLREAADQLEYLSQEFGAKITALESVLAKLHIGIAVWEQMSAGDGWVCSVGYAKRDGKWGIQLRRVETKGEIAKEETWSINNGPRYMRLDCIPKLGRLLAALVTQAERTAELTSQRIEQLTELVSSMEEAMPSQLETTKDETEKAE